LRNLPPALRGQARLLLVDRGDEYAFIPLIHEVAVGRVHPDSVCTPITPTPSTSYNVLRAEAAGVDLQNNILLTSSGAIKYRLPRPCAWQRRHSSPEGLSEYFQTFWSLTHALELRRRAE
jgi:NADH dehydrogenase FAD-containing subunit